MNSELIYLKAIAIDRGYSTNVIDHAVKKFSNPLNKRSRNISEHKNLVVLPYYPKISHQISNILRKFKIHSIFAPVNKLKFTCLKDPVPTLNNWGIYEISCQCGLSYIGQTKRALKFRLKEHQNYVKNQDVNKSSIAQHCWNTNHNFNFTSAAIIQKCPSYLDLDFFEAFHIHKNSFNLVNDTSMVPFLHQIWLSTLNISRTNQHPVPNPHSTSTNQHSALPGGGP